MAPESCTSFNLFYQFISILLILGKSTKILPELVHLNLIQIFKKDFVYSFVHLSNLGEQTYIATLLELQWVPTLLFLLIYLYTLKTVDGFSIKETIQKTRHDFYQ